MKIQIRDIDELTHTAAKVAAARAGVSLNKFLLDATRAAVLRAAQKDPVVARVLEDRKAPHARPR